MFAREEEEMIVPWCPPVRLRHRDELPPERERMPGKWPMTYDNFVGFPDRAAITKNVLEEISMLPPAICSCCGRELAGDLPRQYESLAPGTILGQMTPGNLAVRATLVYAASRMVSLTGKCRGSTNENRI